MLLAAGLVRRAPIVSGQGFEIENVKNCTIMVLDHSEQVQIDAVEDSKIFIGACCSSVFIRDCKNCTFTVACKQLRTRDCDNIEINLFCISEPVVEATTNARIHPFNGSYAGIADSFKAANLNVEQNTWFVRAQDGLAALSLCSEVDCVWAFCPDSPPLSSLMLLPMAF